MATYTAKVTWRLRDGEDFPRGRYSGGHTVSFHGGISVPASASPHVVGKWAVEAAVDPEEMLVAGRFPTPHALLPARGTARWLHGRRLLRLCKGVMEDIAPGKRAVTKVVLHPKIEWMGSAPDTKKLGKI